MHQLLRSIVKAVALVPALVTLVALRVVRHWIDVRLMVVGFHKFGHLALEPELALLEIEAEETLREGRNPKIITWWSFGPKRLRANYYLVDKWKQVLRTKPSWWINALVRIGVMFPFLELQAPMLSIQRPMQQLLKTKSRIQFSIAECNTATKELSLFGIDPKKPFVCLVVRDDGHYGDVLLSDNPNFLSSNFDVEEFVAASRALVDRGYQVIRMGAGKEKPLIDNFPGIFDYAKSKIRSPFLDVYLAANCAFAISTQTGPDAVSLLFRRPVCFIDIPIFSQFFFGTELAMWNPCTLIKDGVKISLDEIVSSEKVWAKYTHDLREQGIDGIRLTSQELTETVLAYAMWYENDFAFSTDDAELIQRANDKISAGMGDKGLVNFGQIRSRICPTYLSRNADWFLR